MGLRIGSGETKQRSAASPGQPVHRLGAADEEPPLQVKPMSEAGPAEPAGALDRVDGRRDLFGRGGGGGWIDAGGERQSLERRQQPRIRF